MCPPPSTDANSKSIESAGNSDGICGSSSNRWLDSPCCLTWPASRRPGKGAVSCSMMLCAAEHGRRMNVPAKSRGRGKDKGNERKREKKRRSQNKWQIPKRTKIVMLSAFWRNKLTNFADVRSVHFYSMYSICCWMWRWIWYQLNSPDGRHTRRTCDTAANISQILWQRL